MSFTKRSSLGTRKSVPDPSANFKSKRKRGNTDKMSMKSMPAGGGNGDSVYGGGGGDSYCEVMNDGDGDCDSNADDNGRRWWWW